MEIIRLFLAPIRSIVKFPLVQFAFVIILITTLQAADEHTLQGHIFTTLNNLVQSTMIFFSSIWEIKPFTQAWLISGLMITYVYIACIALISLLWFLIRIIIDIVGRWNLFWLRDVIAKERGITAYRAWLPLERIRPSQIPQAKWEEKYGWPANNSPPYPNLLHRFVKQLISYILIICAISLIIEAYTPFPIFSWMVQLIKNIISRLNVHS
ncbi:MAG: hypothetical protein H0U49_02810 [Parachlamydiaceae bacterium]|nr:hypothetical protein [Parachlamydiaceae bacterium]